MTFQTFPLRFSPDKAALLQHEYLQLSKALESQKMLTPTHLDQLSKVLTSMLGEIVESGGWWHLHADAEHGDLLNLPWQFATMNHPNLYLTKGLPLGTGESLPEFEPKLAFPLKVLVMVATPDRINGLSRLGYEEEEKVILDALTPLMRIGAVEVYFTDDGSLKSLQRSLAAETYHVFYFSGHSIYRSLEPDGPMEGILVLEEEESTGIRMVSSDIFASAIVSASNCPPSLVFLSSCQSGYGQFKGQFSGVAHRLLAEGIPAVIAMGWSVTDFWATRFAGAFFRGIADRLPLYQAFKDALAVGGKQSHDALPEEFFQSQSLIPQLFLSQQAAHLVHWEGVPVARLSQTGAHLLEGNSALSYKLKKVHRMLGRPKPDFLFIGRRKERKKALALLRAGRSVLLRGQGGAGKTALAEHLALRLLASDSIRLIPFAFDENMIGLEQLTNALLSYLETDEKLLDIRREVTLLEDPWQKLQRLLKQMQTQKVRPFFIFDNLESFQEGPGGHLIPGKGLPELLEFLVRHSNLPVLLTGRYALVEFQEEELPTIDMNAATSGDFLQKCLHLENLRLLDLPGRSFEATVQLLHKSLGGNYRALEIFEEGLKHHIGDAPTTLAALQCLIDVQTGQVLHEMAKDLLLAQLLSGLSPNERLALELIGQMRRPVLAQALTMQSLPAQHVGTWLEHLANLTLVERREVEGNWYYYVPGLVRTWLEKEGYLSVLLDQAMAGSYYETLVEETELGSIMDLEEAFFHYSNIKQIDKINSIGDKLSKYYYITSMISDALKIAQLSYNLNGEETSPSILNTLGMIYTVFGDQSRAFGYLEKSLTWYRRHRDQEGQGILLNNTARSFILQGEYETALKFLETGLKHSDSKENQSAVFVNRSLIYCLQGDFTNALYWGQKALEVGQEIGYQQGIGDALSALGMTAHGQGAFNQALTYYKESLFIQRQLRNRKAEGEVLNNISRIFDIQQEYQEALSYLEKSLKICQELHDRQGETVVLINLGTAAMGLNDLDRAHLYFQMSENLARQIGNRLAEGTAIHNKARIYEVWQDFDLAKKYLLESLEIRREVADRPGESATLNNYGMILYREGQIEMALQYLEESLIILQETGEMFTLAKGLSNLGGIQFEQGNYDLAITSLIQSFALLNQLDSSDSYIPESYLEEILKIIGPVAFERQVSWAMENGNYVSFQDKS